MGTWNAEAGDLKNDPKRKSNSFIWFIFLTLVVMVMILIGVMLAREASENQKLNSTMNRLKTHGIALDEASLAAEYQANTSIEAALAWEAVFQQLQSGFSNDYSSLGDSDFDKSNALILGSIFVDPSRLAALRRFLEKYDQPYRQTIDCSMNSTSPRFIKKFEGIQTLLPHCAEVRKAARLVKLHGLIAIHDRSPSAVLTDIETLLGCADAISSGPWLIEQLVASSIHKSAQQLLKTSIEQNLLPATVLQRLLPRLVERSDIGPEWQRGLRSEIAGILPVFLDSENRSLAMSNQSDAWLSYLPLRSADANIYLDLLERALAIPTGDLQLFQAEIAKLSKEQTSLKHANFLHRIDSALTAELTPDFAKLGDRFIDNAIQYRLCAIGAAIRLHELETGKLPTDLASLNKFGVDCSRLKPVIASSFSYDPTLPITLWDPDSASKQSYAGLSQEELKEYMQNRGPSEWQIVPAK